MHKLAGSSRAGARLARLVLLGLVWRSYSLQTGWKKIETAGPWWFAERFCFRRFRVQEEDETKSVSLDGKLRYWVRHRPTDLIKLVVYTNGWDQFNRIQQPESAKTGARYDCAKRIEKAAKVVDLYSTEVAIGKYVETSGELQFHGAQNHWAFVAFMNCARSDSECKTWTLPDGTVKQYCQTGMDAQYKFEMTNPGGGRLYKEFSSDESGVLPTFIAFFISQTLLMVISLMVRMGLKSQRKYHHTAKMVVWAVFWQWVSIVVGLVYYARFALNGKVSFESLIVVQCFRILSDILMLLTFIVLGKGWTIVRRKISVQGRIKIAIYASTYFVVSVGALTAHYTLYPPDEISYYYGSPPGVTLIVLRVAAAFWFLYAVRTTQNNFGMKKRFYRKFTYVGLGWILSLPAVALIGSWTDDASRAILVIVLELVCISLGQYALVLMYNPSTRFNRSFPFHAKTSDDLGLRKGVKRWADNMNRSSTGTGFASDMNAQAAGIDTAQSVSVSGGLGSGRSQDSKILLTDGFEKLHLARLKRVHQDLEDRIALLQLHSHELGNALGLLDFGGTIDEILQEPEARPMRRGPDPMGRPSGRSWLPQGRQQQQRPPPGGQDMRPRGALDEALDQSLPQHSFAAQRGQQNRGGPPMNGLPPES